jgi:hypothetical protein
MEDQATNQEDRSTVEVPVETPVEKEEHFNVIEFFDLSTDDYEEETVATKIQAKIGTSVLQMQEALSQSVIKRAEELTLDFRNIAPLGDYGKLIEDNDGMCLFLKEEGHKPQHWKLFLIEYHHKRQLLSFAFANHGVDDGETFEGFVFVTKAGKIKHAFAQVKE